MTEDVKMNLYNDLLYIKVNNGSKLSATLNKSITQKYVSEASMIILLPALMKAIMNLTAKHMCCIIMDWEEHVFHKTRL